MSPRVEDPFITALYAGQVHDLTRFVTSLVNGDRNSADDVVQETFIRAWRYRATLERPPEQLRSWLFTVARRIVINNWRSSQRRPRVVTHIVPEVVEGDATDVVDTRHVVSSALEKLSPPHRQVLTEVYVHDLSVEQIAGRLRIPAGTVKSRTHYALMALKQALVVE